MPRLCLLQHSRPVSDGMWHTIAAPLNEDNSQGVETCVGVDFKWFAQVGKSQNRSFHQCLLQRVKRLLCSFLPLEFCPFSCELCKGPGNGCKMWRLKKPQAPRKRRMSLADCGLFMAAMVVTFSGLGRTPPPPTTNPKCFPWCLAKSHFSRFSRFIPASSRRLIVLRRCYICSAKDVEDITNTDNSTTFIVRWNVVGAVERPNVRRRN